MKSIKQQLRKHGLVVTSKVADKKLTTKDGDKLAGVDWEGAILDGLDLDALSSNVQIIVAEDRELASDVLSAVNDGWIVTVLCSDSGEASCALCVKSGLGATKHDSTDDAIKVINKNQGDVKFFLDLLKR